MNHSKIIYKTLEIILSLAIFLTIKHFFGFEDSVLAACAMICAEISDLKKK